MNIIFAKDFYKVSHIDQYPRGTEYIYSNFTPRTSRIEGIDKVILFGLQAFIKKYLVATRGGSLVSEANCKLYKDIMKNCLGSAGEYKHIKSLLNLGYLPIEIKALPEGSHVPLRVPMFTIVNTIPEFFWVPNMIESLLSCELWHACTSATIAYQYRKLLQSFSNQTCDNDDHLDYQAHDFSFRGLSSLDAVKSVGMGHLLSFRGTDSIPAIMAASEYYHAPLNIGCSVPATEHSVMQSYGKDAEFETYKRLITEIYPSGIIAIVSDTWSLFNVIDDYLRTLKDDILKRDGKVVIRPDSGDPIDIICGNENCRGVIERLWEIFGGHINSKGYRVLDPHIGCIYGDSITYDRCNRICDKLMKMGFASSNVVFGIGSYTYQYNTRDTFGFAMKSTWVQINGKGVDIFKDPKTDDGVKRSLMGKLKVIKDHDHNEFMAIDQLSESSHYEDDCLRSVYKNGELVIDEDFMTIKNRVNK